MKAAATNGAAAPNAPKSRGGRPPKAPGEAYTERAELRMTVEQRAVYERLGGARWLREQLDKAGKA